MTPAERWRRVQELCEQAEALPTDRREAFFATLDPELRDPARALLHSLEAEAVARGTITMTIAADEEAPALPDAIGIYRITGVLGRGGTGTVYSAEHLVDGVPHRVAVKLLHLHLIEGEPVERFAREHRMLAELDHPGICRVLDAGITPGRQPFLVMEYVDGKPIDAHADALSMDLADRITLVIAVCQTVQAAHNRLIVHLDLKPQNLMVTAGGAVKLLDFGTAKLLNPAAALTTTRQLTPLYASPEQLRGEAVTTACDIYSLGLILYELLSGAWPFGSRTSIVAVAERAAGTTTGRRMGDSVSAEIAQRRRSSPERLRGLLQGDIQSVVMKALAPEPRDRYATVRELGEDLQRYLDRRPVLAKPQTRLYRLRKYSARHAGSITVAAVLILGLAGALGYGIWQQTRALAAGRRSEATSRFLLWLIQSSNPQYGGRTDMTVADLADRAGERLIADRSLDDETASNLAATLSYFASTMGRGESGDALAKEALARARRGGGPVAEQGALIVLGGLAFGRGDCKEAVRLYSEGTELIRSRRLELADHVRAGQLVSHGQVKEACERDFAAFLAMTTEAVALSRGIPDDSLSTGMPATLFKALIMNGHAHALIRNQKLPEARQAITEGMSLAQAHPDGRGAHIALLRTLAGVEYGEQNVTAAARALEDAADQARGYSAPFEAIRLQVMAARRWAEAGDQPRAVTLTDRALGEATAAGAQLDQTRWMILVDAAVAYQVSGVCTKALDVAATAESAGPKPMPPQWQGNRLAAEAQCLAASGDPRARAKAAQALELLNPFLVPTSTMRKRLETIAGK